MEFGFQISINRGIPDSKAQIFRLHKQKISGFQYQVTLNGAKSITEKVQVPATREG